jgi:hypothetical protein
MPRDRIQMPVHVSSGGAAQNFQFSNDLEPERTFTNRAWMTGMDCETAIPACVRPTDDAGLARAAMV